GPGHLLVSHDTGATWRAITLPPGADPDPVAWFFDSTHGLLIPGRPQDIVGRVWYATSDGGRSWHSIAQGGPAWRLGTMFDFVSPATGFAWNPGAQPAQVYSTANGGRAWSLFVPLG